MILTVAERHETLRHFMIQSNSHQNYFQFQFTEYGGE